jgi:hypothetical protein
MKTYFALSSGGCTRTRPLALCWCLLGRDLHACAHSALCTIIWPRYQCLLNGKENCKTWLPFLEFMSESWGLDLYYYRAAQALRALADEQLPPPVVQHWLWTPDPQHQGTFQHTLNRYFNNIPDMTWSLLARFRRLAPGETHFVFCVPGKCQIMCMSLHV